MHEAGRRREEARGAQREAETPDKERERGMEQTSWLAGWYLIRSWNEYFTGHKAETLQQRQHHLRSKLDSCFCLRVCVGPKKRILYYLCFPCKRECFLSRSDEPKLRICFCCWIIYRGRGIRDESNAARRRCWVERSRNLTEWII